MPVIWDAEKPATTPASTGGVIWDDALPAGEDRALTQPQIASAPAQGIASGVNAGLSAARDWFQPAANNLVNLATEVLSPPKFDQSPFSGPRGIFTGASPETQAPPSSSAGRVAAEIVNPVPRDLPSAGAQAGTIAGGPFGVLGRVGLGILGAGAGSAAQGDTPAQMSGHAAVAGAGGLVGETLGKVIPWFRRVAGGAKADIAHGDAAAMQNVSGELATGLGGAPAQGTSGSERLRSLVATEAGQTGMSAAKEQVMTGLESALGGRMISVPSVGASPMNRTGQVSIRDANAALTEIGEGLRHRDIADPTLRQKVVAQEYAKVAEEIRQGLDSVTPGLGAIWDAGQRDYRAGLFLTDLISSKAAWRPGNAGPELNTQYLQDRLLDPSVEREARRALGDAGFAKIVDSLTRGGGVGSVDILSPGRGGIGQSVGQFERGSNTGSWGLPLAIVRAGLPNLGSSYVGKQPYATSPGTQALLDYLGVKTADQFQRAQSGTPVKIGPIPGR